MGSVFLFQKILTVPSRFFFAFFISLVLVAFGQPAWFSPLACFSAIFGYALFWWGLSYFPTKKSKFLWAGLWFFLVQLIQLSWMSSIQYQGPFILIVYVGLSLAIGLQFGTFCLFVFHKTSLYVLHALAMASFWTFMEWLRIFVLTGFTWNPVGMALSGYTIHMQMASIVGVYGLSFWVILTNAFVYKAWKEKSAFLWKWAFFCAFFPLVFGFFHMAYQSKQMQIKEEMQALLIQTALTPEQKDRMFQYSSTCLSPLYQWKRIFLFLKDHKKPVDFIIFPEAAVPLGFHRFPYFYSQIKQILTEEFGKDGHAFLPLLSSKYVKNFGTQNKPIWKVSNAFIVQALANYYQAHVIIGLDDVDLLKDEMYNAAFCFSNNRDPQRYIKRVLVPIGEFIPFQWCSSLAEKFGIFSSFSPGKEEKIFEGTHPIAVSICYEETYADLIRMSRKKGAEIFVNITNDVWFPNSRLPKQHFDHGRLRAIENGVPLLRACNTGITGIVDCFGSVLKTFEKPDVSTEKLAGVLHWTFPFRTYFTLYTIWGDGFIIGLSALFLVLFFHKNLRLLKKMDVR